MGLLRITLAIAVIITHMQLGRVLMISGGQSVKVFFMISGFYMAMILRQKYGFTKSGLWDFAKNRFLRLYPLYFFVLVATVAWYLTCEWATNGGTPEPLLLRFSRQAPFRESLGFWFTNLALVGSDIPSLFHWNPSESKLLFLADLPFEEHHGIFWMGYSLWVRQAWSVGAEIWFYASAPFLVFLPRLWMRAVCWLILYAFTIAMHVFHPGPAYFFWPALLSYFATGVLLFDGYQSLQLKDRLPLWHPVLRRTLYFSPLLWTFLLPVCGYQLADSVQNLLAAVSIPILFALTSGNHADRLVGDLSYGIYLNHLLVISIISVISKRIGLSGSIPAVLMVVGSCVAAYVTLLIIERPVEKIRSRISREAKLAQSASKI